MDRLTREVDAHASRHPTRAASLLAAQAHVYVTATSDPLAATAALTRAAELAPEARFVANTWRWFAERSGDPGAALERSRAELAVVAEPRERVAILWRAAAIEEHFAGDVAASMRTLSELLALEPNDLAALDALAALHLRSRSGDGRQWDISSASDATVFGGVVGVLERMASLVSDETTQSALYAASGGLRARYLDDPEGAITAVRRSLAIDPTNDAAASTLEAVLRRRRAWEQYAHAIEARAERTSEPRVARERHERAGDLYAECVGDAALAARSFERASVLDASDPAPLEKLAAVLEASGQWKEAAGALERLVGRLTDPIERAWALLRLANLREERLEQPEEAVDARRRAVEIAPAFPPAVLALLRSAKQRGLPIAIELELREADRIADGAARAVRYAALADAVAAGTAGADGPERALSLYERTLALDPSNAAAFDALDRAYRRLPDPSRLVALYEAALDATRDPRRLRSLRLQLAEIVEARAAGSDRAATLRLEALAGPDDRYDVLVSLARALADAGRWPEHVEVLETQASMLSGTDEIAAVFRIGAALETRLGDRERALSAYEIVLDRAPKHEAAARAVARIHEREGRWEKVIDRERRLLDLASRTEDALEGLGRIATILEERLGRPAEAVLVLLEAFERAPTALPIVTALERLLRGARDYRKLASILTRHAESISDLQRRARARLRAASIFELHLDDTASAVAACVEARADAELANDDAGRHAALAALARLHEVRGEWSNVANTLGTLRDSTRDPATSISVSIQLAQNAELRLDDLASAGRFYEDALGAGATPAAIAVDRLRIARLERNGTAATWLGTSAKGTSDPALRQALLLELAASAEVERPGENEATDLYAELVRQRPDDPRALEGLVRTNARGSADSAHHCAALCSRARATADVPLRALLFFAAGVVAEAAAQSSTAEAAYAESLDSDPDGLPALDATRRLRGTAEDFRASATFAERFAKGALDRANVADAWLEAATLHEMRLDDPKRALSCLLSLVAKQPEHRGAIEHALGLLLTANDFAGAAAVLRTQAEASAAEPSVRRRALVRRGLLLAERLDDAAGAVVDLRRALEIASDESDLETVQRLAELEETQRSWQEALELHERLARASSAESGARDDASYRRARLAQARIFGEELRDDDRSKTLLESLVLSDPSDREATWRLAEASARSGEDGRATGLYEHLATMGSPGERSLALVALAELHRGRSDAASRASSEAALARAFDLATVDPSVVIALEQRFSQDPRLFVALAEAAALRVRPNTPGIVPLRTAIARTLRGKLANPESADRQLASIIQAFPDSIATRLELADALLGRNDDAALVELRRAVGSDPFAVAPFEALLRLTRAKGPSEATTLLTSAVLFLSELHGDRTSAAAALARRRPLPDSFRFEEATARFVGPTRAPVVRSVLAQLEPYLGKIFPGGEALLETRPRLAESHPVVDEVRAIAGALGVRPPHVHRGVGHEVALALTDPRALVLGSDVFANGDALAAFHGAYACSRIAASGSAYVLPRTQLVTLVDAATGADGDATTRDLRKRVAAALPRKTRKDLERIGSEATSDLHAELATWETEEARRSLFTAVVLCRDVGAVARVFASEALAKADVEARRRTVTADVRLREVLELVASAPCWDALRRIYGR